ncbi:ATP-binding protein [Novispirillum itersonii]|uniref:Putative esterase YcpF (UPF0227 family) n=1 Tax=Novispirillum itersonii TaxID=189 RepID=A0A7W9ZJ27_NOVIT|nr:ATP-binding protein [Novispirillum itersonii]MBB6212410.1 putative esterase YcpF (UPF0227 family) [Novispirillum itersonii]
MQRYDVEVQGDYLERLSKARPVSAIAELVWNAVDADATKVEIEIERNELGMTAVIVRDNGHGLPLADAPLLFSNLGGSWKRNGSRSKIKSRMLHGQEGKGRFKAFALGRVVDWSVAYRGDDGKVRHYTISMFGERLRHIDVSDEEVVEAPTGVEVRITELSREWRSLESDNAHQELTEIFALYLTDYPDVSIALHSVKFDPAQVIKNRKRLSLPEIVADGQCFDAELDLIEWRVNTQKALYLCDANGFPLARTQNRFHVGEFQFSAYLRSQYVSKLNDEGTLELMDMNAPLQFACEQAIQQIKEHFKERTAEDTRSLVEEWKTEQVYPFQGEPENQLEDAERKVFDIVAVNVTRHLPDFSSATPRNKAFHLRMLRQAIEHSPEDLQLILKEVLDLPQRKQQELAKLLKESSLSAIIGASKMVADRLKFITGLEAILFDPDSKGRLKERSQLHRILAENTWVFGEEFNLTVDDQSLTEVLRQHAKLAKKEVKIDEPVKRIDGKRGIIDLMLSRSIKRNRADELEHMVVELKAPSVSIGSDEITQIEKYAFSVADDDRFHGIKTRWEFWIISNALDRYAQNRARSAHLPEGVIHKSDDGLMTIHAKTWSQVIQENKTRLRFFKEKLEHTADRGASLRYLQETYEAYLEGVITEDDADDQPIAEQEDTAAAS